MTNLQSLIPEYFFSCVVPIHVNIQIKFYSLFCIGKTVCLLLQGKNMN
jgi:hypothetical protein